MNSVHCNIIDRNNKQSKWKEYKKVFIIFFKLVRLRNFLIDIIFKTSVFVFINAGNISESKYIEDLFIAVLINIILSKSTIKE